MKKVGYYTKSFVRYLRNTKAVSAIEYAILVGVVATAMGAAVMTFQESIATALDGIGTDLEGAGLGGGPGDITSGGGSGGGGGGGGGGNDS